MVEKRYVFFPTSEIELTPADVGLDYEDVYFPTANENRLHGWYVPGTGNGTWLWFHGNGGNVGHRVAELALLRHRLGMDLFMFDYQGYGRSQGTPAERATYQDARGAWDFLQRHNSGNAGPLIYYGHSLGTAIATELALERPPDGLVLVSPFTSVSDMASRAFPWLPSYLLLKDHYNTLARIPNVRCPLLILHGTQDELVPVSHGEKLFKAASVPKEFRALPDAGHNDTFEAGGEDYWTAIEAFLAVL